MKSVWEVLGIERTTDVKQIKQAYAAKAKEWHPEEHPQEYQMLQKAYKGAIQAAKMQSPGDIYVETPNLDLPQETEKVPQNADSEPEEFIKEPIIQGTAIERDNKLDFGEVQKEHTKAVRDRFFREFRYIVWNPYLKDNFIVWRSFLGNPEYQELFLEKEFPGKFLHSVSSYSHWNDEVLDFFAERVETLSKNGSYNKKIWKKIRFLHRLENLFSVEGVMPFREGIRGVHEMMLKQVKNKGIEVVGRISSREEANCYLGFYLPYAAEHEQSLKEASKKHYRSRKKHYRSEDELEGKKIFYYMAIFLLIILFLGGVLKGRRWGMKEDLGKQLEDLEKQTENMRPVMDMIIQSDLVDLLPPEVQESVKEELQESQRDVSGN